MDILCVSDLHGEVQARQFLFDFINRARPDAVILAGDITCGSVAYAEELFDELDRKAKIPYYAVHGNNDPETVQDFFEESGRNLAGKRVEIGGLPFYGLGGSGPTPFNTVCEYSEDEIALKLADLGVPDGEKFVLVSHAPPRDTASDTTSRGNHVGSRALREFVLQKKPVALVCGHVHEQHLTEKLGDTVIAKAGALMRRKALVLSVPEYKVTLL
jgi:Icc-related predicted phosphoesterase